MTPWLMACASVRASLGALPDYDAAEVTEVLRGLRAWARGQDGTPLPWLLRRAWLVRGWWLQEMSDVRRDPKAPRGAYAAAYRRYLVAQLAHGLVLAALEPEHADEAIRDALALTPLPAEAG